MRYLLCLLSAFELSSPASRGQTQVPEARKIMGLINEESSWSPDGKTIAFDSSRPGKTSIFTWNVETHGMIKHSAMIVSSPDSQTPD